MSDKTGGCAFPNALVYSKDENGRTVPFDAGMTLRDYFAAQALRAVLDTDNYEIAEGRRTLAANCYAIADAMLAERHK